MAITDADYLEIMVRPLVNKQDEVKVVRTIDGRGVLLTLHVATDDVRYVIGKLGQTAHAMRRLLRQHGMNNNIHVSMRINDPDPTRRHYEKASST